MAKKSPCPPPLPPVLITPESSLSLSPSFLRSPTAVSFKPLFWKKLVPSCDKTIWQEVSEQQKHVYFNDEIFETLFQKKTHQSDRRSRSVSPARSPCRVLNDKKFQALQILLKNISWDDINKIMTSHKNLDKSSLDIDTIANVANMVLKFDVKNYLSVYLCL